MYFNALILTFFDVLARAVPFSAARLGCSFDSEFLAFAGLLTPSASPFLLTHTLHSQMLFLQIFCIFP